MAPYPHGAVMRSCAWRMIVCSSPSTAFAGLYE